MAQEGNLHYKATTLVYTNKANRHVGDESSSKQKHISVQLWKLYKSMTKDKNHIN